MKFKRGKFYTVLVMLIVISSFFVISPIINLEGKSSDADSDIEVPEIPIVPDVPDDEDSSDDTIYKFTDAITAVNQAFENAEKKGFYSIIDGDLSAIGDLFTFYLKGQRYHDVENNLRTAQMIIKSSPKVPIVKADVDYRFLASPDVVRATDYHLMFDRTGYVCYPYRDTLENYLNDFKMLPDAPIAKFNKSNLEGNASLYRYPGFYRVNATLKPEALEDMVVFLSRLFKRFVNLSVVPKNISMTLNIKANGDLQRIDYVTECMVDIDCREWGMGILSFNGKLKYTENYYSSRYIKPLELNPQYYNTFPDDKI